MTTVILSVLSRSPCAPTGCVDRIYEKLDPSVPLKDLVSDYGPYEDLEPVGGDSLEWRPKAKVPAAA